ncbi:MAG TPA: FAD-dependent oxidoreductase [Bdellovibrionota bacterium]|nr:FAD-dependent oxidoreductase [Bdellovibrionota bacterium]
MPSDCDVALVGTGIAPLVAAKHLLAQGRSVLVLNPDRDFFLEDSELPIDPLLPKPDPERIKASLSESALAELRPHFPGAVEFWSGEAAAPGFHDASAPHVRSRARLWIGRQAARERLEEFYVECSDAGLNPSLLEGLQAVRRFPGHATQAPGADEVGLLVPKLCDVDVSRYRNGLLEFVRERLGEEHLICSATQIEPMPEGVRFHAGGSPRTARVRARMLVFWTPQLSRWVLSQAKRFEVQPVLPSGIRLWEEWTIQSRDPIDPGSAGVFEDMTVWCGAEGSPPTSGPAMHDLTVLRPGRLVGIDSVNTPESGMSWANAESFAALESLCLGFLRWERFSIRAMRPRAIFEWEPGARPWRLTDAEPLGLVVPGCDGPLLTAVQVARAACETKGVRR